MATFPYNESPRSPWDDFSNEEIAAIISPVHDSSQADLLLGESDNTQSFAADGADPVRPESVHGHDIADRLPLFAGGPASFESLTTEERNWAAGDIVIAGRGIGDTYKRASAGRVWVPTVGELAIHNPDFANTISRLYQARNSLLMAPEKSTGGLNVGETMQLVLIPWQEIRRHLTDYDQWVKALRTAQGLVTQEDFMNPDLLAAIKEDLPLYRDPYDDPSKLITPSEYVDENIAREGPWGVILMQTSKEAGIARVGGSPDDMTNKGVERTGWKDQYVDVMGVLEWIALTMQVNPQQLSPGGRGGSWLLANRLVLGREAYVPLAYWNRRVNTYLYRANNGHENLHARLAVM